MVPILSMDQWREQFLKLCGGSLCDDYVVIDTETTGLTPDDLPTQIGYVLVRGREVVNRGNYWLNWTKVGVTEEWLTDRLRHVEAHMQSKGVAYQGYLEHTLTGEDPDVVLQFCEQLLRTNDEAGGWLVGHNLIGFDLGRLQQAATVLWQKDWYTPDNILDTGAIEKSLVLRNPVRDPQKPGALVRYQRAQLNAYVKNKIPWSLSALVQKYKLDVDLRQLHGAEADAYATHLVLEAQRALVEKEGVPCVNT